MSIFKTIWKLLRTLLSNTTNLLERYSTVEAEANLALQDFDKNIVAVEKLYKDTRKKYHITSNEVEENDSTISNMHKELTFLMTEPVNDEFYSKAKIIAMHKQQLETIQKSKKEYLSKLEESSNTLESRLLELKEKRVNIQTELHTLTVNADLAKLNISLGDKNPIDTVSIQSIRDKVKSLQSEGSALKDLNELSDTSSTIQTNKSIDDLLDKYRK